MVRKKAGDVAGDVAVKKENSTTARLGASRLLVRWRRAPYEMLRHRRHEGPEPVQSPRAERRQIASFSPLTTCHRLDNHTQETRTFQRKEHILFLREHTIKIAVPCKN